MPSTVLDKRKLGKRVKESSQNLLYGVVTRIEYSTTYSTVLDPSRHSADAIALLSLPIQYQICPRKVLQC